MVTSIYSPDEAQRTIWVHIEYENGDIAKVSREMLSKARDLARSAGWGVGALLLCESKEPYLPQMSELGVEDVFVVEHPKLKDPVVDTHAFAAEHCILQEKPSIIFFGATPFGRDLAGRLAVRFRTGLTADVFDFAFKEGSDTLIAKVSGFGGGIIALIEIPNHRPQMMTIRPGVFEVTQPETSAQTRVRTYTPDLDTFTPHSFLRQRIRKDTPDLTSAPFLAIGGRGMHGNFQLLRELAELLGGEVGATRPPVDEGHIERDRQIGQTGLTVRPKVALVCGVSGAFQFTVGIQDADTIIAINIDPEAAIFESADYCIVGNVFEILPHLIRILQQKKKGVIHA